LKRHVSYGELFMQTHTRADGSFVDQIYQHVGEAYMKMMEERMAEMDEDGPQVSDNSSQHSTHRTLNIDEKNEIFLKVIYFCFYFAYNLLVFVCLDYD